MRPENTEKELRGLLKSSGKLLKGLSAGEVLQISTDFWLSSKLEGVRPERGDGLVAYFDLLSRGRGGTLFEFGVNRIMTLASEEEDYAAWLPAFKLRLSVGFKSTLEVFQLEPVVTSFSCWDKESVSDFLEEVHASPAFQLVAAYTQHSSGIELAECGTLWGDPVHPTRGLTWAIA